MYPAAETCFTYSKQPDSQSSEDDGADYGDSDGGYEDVSATETKNRTGSTAAKEVAADS